MTHMQFVFIINSLYCQKCLLESFYPSFDVSYVENLICKPLVATKGFLHRGACGCVNNCIPRWKDNDEPFMKWRRKE